MDARTCQGESGSLHETLLNLDPNHLDAAVTSVSAPLGPLKELPNGITPPRPFPPPGHSSTSQIF